MKVKAYVYDIFVLYLPGLAKAFPSIVDVVDFCDSLKDTSFAKAAKKLGLSKPDIKAFELLLIAFGRSSSGAFSEAFDGTGSSLACLLLILQSYVEDKLSPKLDACWPGTISLPPTCTRSLRIADFVLKNEALIKRMCPEQRILDLIFEDKSGSLDVSFISELGLQRVEYMSKTSFFLDPSETTVVINRLSNCNVFCRGKFHTVLVQDCNDCEFWFEKPLTNLVRISRCDKSSFKFCSPILLVDNCARCIFSVSTINRPVIAGDSRGVVLSPFSLLVPIEFVWNPPDPLIWSNPIVCSVLQSFQFMEPEKFHVSVFPSEAREKRKLLDLPEKYASVVAGRQEALKKLNEELQAISEEKREKVKNRFAEIFKEWLVNNRKIISVSL